MIRGLLENLGWKLFSLVVAIVLWVTFIGSPELVTSISAPIQYQNMPSKLEISSDLPEGVFLEIQGPSNRLHTFDLSRTSVVLNLSGVVRPGENTFTIDSSNVDLPKGLTLMRAVPSQLRLTFEYTREAAVPVRVRFATRPPAGYRVAEEKVTPSSVKIIGPESRVKEVDHAETDAIDLSNTTGKADFKVHTFVRDPHVRLVSSPFVHVTVTLEKTAKGG